MLTEASDLQSGKLHAETCKEAILKYLETDTLVYWDHAGTNMRKLQDDEWQPALARVSALLQLPAIRFTTSFAPVQQDPALLDKFRAMLDSLTCFELASTPVNHYRLLMFPSGLSLLTTSTKSAILAWALARNVFTPEEAVRLSLLEQHHQYETWGKRKEYHLLTETDLLCKMYLCKLFFKE